MLLAADLVTGPDQIPHRFILRIGKIDGRQLSGAIEPSQLIGVATVGLDPVARFARNFGGSHDDAFMALGAEETAEGITARTGFVAKAQLRAEMSGRESLDELEHVVVRATDEAVTAHLRGVTRRQGNG